MIDLSLQVRMLFAHMAVCTIDVLKILPCPPPDAYNLHRETRNDEHGAGIRTLIDIPRPLLRRPDCVQQYRMQSSFPQQERRGPRNVSEELVVQAPRTEHANGVGGEYGREGEGGYNCKGYLLLS